MPTHCALTSFPLTVSGAGAELRNARPCLHHPIAGKHLPGPRVSGAAAELGIDGGLLDILVMNPFFRFQLTWMAEEN